ncbi:hypothetical protein GC173_16255 [bacterium]|nr:hypothetical protein [bacterium]
MRINDGLRDLAGQAPDRSLQGLETRVWAEIGARQRTPSPALLWGWRSAAAALVLTLGLVSQSASGAHARAAEFELFSPNAALAPSTLLGDAP